MGVISLYTRGGRLKERAVRDAQIARERETVRRNTKRWKTVRKHELTTFVDTYKTMFGCVHCGETDPACLDFHHRDQDTKRAAVSVLVAKCSPLDVVKDEMKKCVLVCANCHRRLHVHERFFQGLDRDDQVIVEPRIAFSMSPRKTL